MTTETAQKKMQHREDPAALAVKCLLVNELEKAMKDQQKTKTALARDLQTSRWYLNRILDPQHTTVSLLCITRAASVLGKRLSFTISDVTPA
jgi:antitoxin HicB